MSEQFDIIGDVHSCFCELSDLMDKLGHQWDKTNAVHKPRYGRKIVFLGDLMDRGPHPLTCYAYAKMMVDKGYASWVLGNHCDKLRRWAMGRDVKQSNGLAKTIWEFEKTGVDRKQVAEFLNTLPQYLVLDEGKLICVHAAWRDDLINEKLGSGLLRSWCLYGPIRGMLPNGMPDRIDWVADRQFDEQSPLVVYGHQPLEQVRMLNQTAGIDTGCVFGGHLTALRYPEMTIVQVRSVRPYCERP